MERSHGERELTLGVGFVVIQPGFAGERLKAHGRLRRRGEIDQTIFRRHQGKEPIGQQIRGDDIDDKEKIDAIRRQRIGILNTPAWLMSISRSQIVENSKVSASWTRSMCRAVAGTDPVA